MDRSKSCLDEVRMRGRERSKLPICRIEYILTDSASRTYKKHIVGK